MAVDELGGDDLVEREAGLVARLQEGERLVDPLVAAVQRQDVLVGAAVGRAAMLPHVLQYQRLGEVYLLEVECFCKHRLAV